MNRRELIKQLTEVEDGFRLHPLSKPEALQALGSLLDDLVKVVNNLSRSSLTSDERNGMAMLKDFLAEHSGSFYTVYADGTILVQFDMGGDEIRQFSSWIDLLTEGL